MPTTVPGLPLLASEDPFVDDATGRGTGGALGMQVRALEGVGHRWAPQATAEAAVAIGGLGRPVG